MFYLQYQCFNENSTCNHKFIPVPFRLQFKAAATCTYFLPLCNKKYFKIPAHSAKDKEPYFTT